MENGKLPPQLTGNKNVTREKGRGTPKTWVLKKIPVKRWGHSKDLGIKKDTRDLDEAF